MNWDRKKTHLKRRIIAVGAAIVIAVLALAMCGGSERRGSGALVDKGNVYSGIESYCVSSGDTLWGIAKKYCSQDIDVREWIEDVKKLNERTSSTIYFGETIKVYLCD